MCMFSGDISEVSATHIFARSDADWQFLVYQMTYAASEELAMVLPLPVAISSPDDAVQFISLESYPDFFADLYSGFPTRSLAYAAGIDLSADELLVHDVGMYEASYVPCLEAFSRLDRRFRLSPQTWESLPQYANYGFAVFRLKRSADPHELHPMALKFPRRNHELLYFPTLHVHDGQSHPDAEFDHSLYCQADELVDYLTDWWQSPDTADQFMDLSLAADILIPQSHVWQRHISGLNTNTDSCVGDSAPFPKAV